MAWKTVAILLVFSVTNMADVSLFRDANNAVVTSYAYALYKNVVRFKPSKITVPELLLLLRFAVFLFLRRLFVIYTVKKYLCNFPCN